jgi:phosphate starvation-inducible PhoH-like protein
MAQSTPAPRPARTRAAQSVPAAPARVEHRITVPAAISMVELLGLRDEVLKAVESGFPTVDVHVRGNEVRLAGPVGDVALVSRLVDELVETAAAGTALSPEVVTR